MRSSILLVLGISMFVHNLARGEIIDARTEEIGRGAEFAKSKGGPENNRLELVAQPVRAGSQAFKHWINTQGERSELATMKTEIGGTYWYGWSMMLPEDYDFGPDRSRSIVMQLATYPTPRNGKFPCSANGSYMSVEREGKVVFYLQRQGDDADMVCDKFTIVDDASQLRGKWLDFVMHAKWTGDADGFLKLWVKADDNHYFQRINYQGRTFWNDEDRGPYFKMGLYTGEPGWKGGPERVVYTDEFRLGNEASSFDEVAPGVEERRAQANSGCLELLTDPSTINRQSVLIGANAPPGYEAGNERYPVVCGLHGAGGGRSTRQWQQAGRVAGFEASAMPQRNRPATGGLRLSPARLLLCRPFPKVRRGCSIETQPRRART